MPRMERRSIAVVVSLIASLVVVAILQYRWVDQISRAQKEALRASLDENARELSSDLEREIGRAFNCFQRRPEEGWRCWSDNALESRIVRASFVFDDEGLKRFDPTTGTLVEENWPTAIEAARRRPRRPVEPRQLFALGNEIVMFVPQPPLPPPRRDEVGDEGPPFGGPRPRREDLFGEPPPPPPARGRPRPSDNLGLVQFDAEAIRTLLLPKLRDMHLRNADMAIFPAGDRSHPFYRTAVVTRFAKPDIVHPLPPPHEPQEGKPLWDLAVVHRAGSLDAAVSSARRRNVITSSIVLLLLAISVAMLLVTTRRAQTLARQQIDFVAGVSHELNTPLAAIRSAAENLADGVVRDDEQLRRYGAMITREGRRLSTMVEKILTYAGLQSSAKWRRDAVDVKDVVDRVAADSRWMLDERGGTITLDVDGVPPVRGDAEALRRALQNIVENAIKYGGTPPRIEIHAASHSRSVVVRVEDNGAGFSETDLPHVFEPFYRGHLVVARALPGSGLGLSLVQRIVEGHGGRVSVSNRTGGGAVVTIHLPTA